MAIFYQKISVIKRSKGHSVVKAAAYQAREKLTQERTGKIIDYSSNQDLLGSGILAPDGAEDWVFEREDLWNRAEAAEKRRDAQLARKIIMALPHELSQVQQQQLLEDYLRQNFVQKGMVADYAIHAPETDGDQRNVHAHVLLTLRPLDGDGFAKKKNRDWNKKTLVEDWRASWATMTNQHLQQMGLEGTIDHRSYKRQNRNKLSQKHQGKQATHQERRTGEKTRIGDYNRNVVSINEMLDELDQMDTQDNEDLIELLSFGVDLLEDFESNTAEEGKFKALAQQGKSLQERVEDRRQLQRQQVSHKAQPLERFSHSQRPGQQVAGGPGILQRKRRIGPRIDREMEAINKAVMVGNKFKGKGEPRDVVNNYRYYLAQVARKNDRRKMAAHYNRHSETAFQADLFIVQKLRARGFSAQEIRRAFRRANPALYKKSLGYAKLYTRKFEGWMRQQRQVTQQGEKQQKRSPDEKRYRRSRGR